MKRFGERLVKRTYTKRIVAVLIAAVVLLGVIAILIPTTLHKQIAELRALEEAREAQEKTETAGGETVAPAGTKTEREKDSRKHELKAMLRQLTPVGRGTKAAFAAVALLAFLLGVFYWITVAEWLYKTAVLQGLNRALWPMLGLVFNIAAVPLLLIVLCDPRRTAAILKERDAIS